ncbi:CGNR zinc finger domain-containing protein [Brevibacterium album]|uniref:CGNR zinc finger domain-containing protein n=1 Tax=Brevibacterium album TaxID=417948 RepID=UPI00040420AB|nr:CGNR zinc finger domain-containing protein [Brevibacterium album]
MQISTHNRSVLGMLTELANSHLEEETIGNSADVRDLARRHSFSPPLHADEADAEALRILREDMRTALLEEKGEERARRTAAFVNELYRRTRTLPELQKHGEWDWHLHAVPNEAALSVRVAADIAVALTDLIVDGELSRIGTCAAPGCGGVFIDFSRNRSKRFCDRGNCANRTHVAAYRARLSQD